MNEVYVATDIFDISPWWRKNPFPFGTNLFFIFAMLRADRLYRWLNGYD